MGARKRGMGGHGVVGLFTHLMERRMKRSRFQCPSPLIICGIQL